MQSFSYEIPSSRRDVVILLPEYHDQFALDVARPGQAIIFLALAQGVAVYVGREVADCRAYSLVQSTPICQMSTQAHSCGTDSTVAGRKGEEEGYRCGRVRVVCGEFLRHEFISSPFVDTQKLGEHMSGGIPS